MHVHICKQIIFSKLYLQLCQPYKHHYCKDMFLDMDFPFGLFPFFIYHVGITTYCSYLAGILFLSHLFAQVLFCVLKHLILFFTLQFQNTIIPFKGCLKALWEG